MKWRVEISDVQGNLRLLGDVLGGLSMTLLEEDQGPFLVSEQFEALHTPGEVHELASGVQSIIEEETKGEAAMQLSFTIGSVIEETRDGSRRKHRFLSAEPGHYGLTGHAATMKVEPSAKASDDERRRLEEEHSEREYQRLRREALTRIVSAFRDDRALQVQRLLQVELTPQTMGHIADLIQSDIGSRMGDLVPDKQLTRFYRSINHPDVFGQQSRHIVSNVQPPPDPMNLEEARNFVRSLANRWMARKAGFNNDT